MKTVILAGGMGSRLWPLSVNSYPKHILKLLSEHSLLQSTVLRAIDSGCTDIIITTSIHDREQIEQQLQELNLPNTVQLSTIYEPLRKDTAAALALTSMLCEADETLWVLPADHLLQTEQLQANLQLAEQLAQKDYLVTFGITPTEANTNYGYIQKQEQLEPSAYSVKAFHEKPNQELAEHYFQSIDHFWNSGMFCFTASTYLDALKQYRPNTYELCKNAVAHSKQDNGQYFFREEDLQTCPKESIDYAVLEQANNVALIPIQARWTDIGSWETLYRLENKDSNNNVTLGKVTCVDTEYCYIRSEQQNIATLGLQNLIIVDTEHGLLIADRQQLGRLKELLNKLPN